MRDQITKSGEASVARIMAEFSEGLGIFDTRCPLAPTVVMTRHGKWGHPDTYTYKDEGVEITEDALREKYTIEGCLFCGLGIPDIHTATRAAQALNRGY